MRRLATALVMVGGMLLSGLWIIVLRRQVRRQTNVWKKIKSEVILDKRQRIAREFHRNRPAERLELRIAD